MRKRVRGFTLIELLVVIAIIGILAAMLFPVFARARESARKTQCLSNVKNIAIAVQMYLVDYDALPPEEHRSEVIDWFNDRGGGDCFRWRAYYANPFLRWPVIFDEYIKNRDVWRCPSARLFRGATWIIPGSDWFAYERDNVDQWGDGGPCKIAWPSGWGGVVTDSIVQQMQAVVQGHPNAAEGAFAQSIATIMAPELKSSAVNDPSWYVVCADGGGQTDNFGPGLLAYPDLCGLECASEPDGPCFYPDWANCSWSQDCGVPGGYKNDPNALKSHTRHLGGVNLGFMDGHAKWMSSQAVLAESPRYSCGCWGGSLVYGKLEGISPWGPTSAAGDAANGVSPGAKPSAACGVPPLY